MKYYRIFKNEWLEMQPEVLKCMCGDPMVGAWEETFGELAKKYPERYKVVDE